MRNVSWQPVLAWALAAFFLVGGLMNIFASEAILSDYRRWGFPDWFHYFTGVLELCAAALLVRAPTRLAGLGLLMVIMTGAAVTTLRHGEFTHSLAPLLVLALAGLLAAGTLMTRAAQGR